jgi:phosphatidylglycerol:prolipoprotein diacylglycerol transferase
MPSLHLTRTPFNTRKLSILFLLFGVVAFAALFYPISLVFAGSWKLNQQIDLFTIDSINIFGFELPIGTVSIRFYSICILLGALAGYALVLYLSKKSYIASTTIDRLFVGMVIVGLVSARLFYAAFNWDKYSINPIEVLTEITRGGLAVFGMLIGCSIYLWSYCRKYKFNFYEFADVIAPGVLLGQVLGRFGNFFNYEAYGGPTSAYWKMFIPQTASIYDDPNEHYFHPTFLYEIIPNYILLVILLYNYDRLTAKRSGLVFGLYAVGYGIIRYCTEFFRLDALTIPFDSTLHIGPFNMDGILVSQVAAVILFLIGAVTIFLRRKVIYSRKTMVEVRV